MLVVEGAVRDRGRRGAGGSPSAWSSVTPLLRARGIAHTLADNAMTSLRDDEASVRALIDGIEGPVLLVGHSYGGAVITNAGTHERVVGLVYVAAFAPDTGESVSAIVERHEPALVAQYTHRGPDGGWITRDDEESRAALAWDVPEDVLRAARYERRVTADAAFQQPTREPAWATRPSWYLVATSDRHLLPEIQRGFVARMRAASEEVDTSHAVAHAAPAQVVAVIERAIAAVS
ncbi:alpha/beta hydrolase [Curtobacterium sp. B18]|uniref:alpha/beta hydrolase n=1 Tax=Curtobacterium sp. B18 TaxID=95614 RepID=UPI0005B28EAC|nr:alpha/beta hydrolase [Curtobacterium sp. B18]